MAEQQAKLKEAGIGQPKSTETMNSKIQKVMDAINLCCNYETEFHYIEQ